MAAVGADTQRHHISDSVKTLWQWGVVFWLSCEERRESDSFEEGGTPGVHLLINLSSYI